MSVNLQVVKATAKSKYGRMPGVRGFGIGHHSVRIYVTHTGVRKSLPSRIEGVPVDVVVTGDISTISGEFSIKSDKKSDKKR